MSETTAISWCDATWNPWIGCTKVSPGCDHCYAESQNHRYNWNHAGWGAGAPRKLTSDTNWKQPMTWARKALSDGARRRVFAGSLCDPLDPEVPSTWRDRYFSLIDDVGEYCQYHRTVEGSGLEFLILTKRIKLAWKFLPAEWLRDPPEYIRLGVTAENQKQADSRIHELLRVWPGKNFISLEPLLEFVDIMPHRYMPANWIYQGIPGVDWIIVGGESGPGCRPMDLEWARIVRNTCAMFRIPFFFKQIGGHPDKRHDPAGWPIDLMVQQFPE